MFKFILFSTSLFFVLNLFASTFQQKEFDKWEQKILEIVEKSRPIPIEKEFTLYLIAGRELGAYGYAEKSKEYYLKAFEIKGDFDKSEAVVQLISLNLNNKKKLIEAYQRAEKWFASNPKKLNSEIKTWLEMIKGSLEGKTPVDGTGQFMAWAEDSRVDELISEKNYKEALQILGPNNLLHADINQKIRQDLLNSAVLGRNSPPLWCEKTLEKYPRSLTWSMRICRFLKDKRNGNKTSETIQSIKDQMKLEESSHLLWAKILEDIK